ncbi:hypothetical protein GOBAR_AA19313 [Gossypium barbadense]|uniref:CCHC-type domain-containing protein n=1 Tax=Gossypium barbadense TaxID=3634 RepID=A0A2P5XDE2_GOSBA|nr:hypothetical protein GOBAR_AA19313 [Gossypium barbadense]
MVEDINVMLENLKFSEEESVQVISTNAENNFQGFETLAVGKIMLRVYNIPLKYMDRQTALDVGNAIGELVAIDWKDRNGGWTELLRLKIKINISNPVRRVVKFMGRDRIEIICALKYERLPTFCYYCGPIGHTIKKCKQGQRLCWLKVNFVASNQKRGIGRNGIEIMVKKTPPNEDKKESKTDTRKDKESVFNSPLEKRCNKPMHDRLIRHRGSNGDNTNESPLKIVRKRLLENVSLSKAAAVRQQLPRAMKILCWNCRGIGNPTTVRELKQLLVANDSDIIFLCETKTHTNKLASMCSKCRMEWCLAVNAMVKVVALL